MTHSCGFCLSRSTVDELRAHPPSGDIRSERPISAEARSLAERAASIRALRQSPHRGMWFVGPSALDAAAEQQRRIADLERELGIGSTDSKAA